MPANSHILQGVSFTVTEKGVSLEPTARRIARVKDNITQALTTDSLSLSPEGKLCLRQWGKAALAPVYSRSHDTAANDRPQLSEGLRAALTPLVQLMDNITKRHSGPPSTPTPSSSKGKTILKPATSRMKPGRDARTAGRIAGGLSSACAMKFATPIWQSPYLAARGFIK